MADTDNSNRSIAANDVTNSVVSTGDHNVFNVTFVVTGGFVGLHAAAGDLRPFRARFEYAVRGSLQVAAIKFLHDQVDGLRHHVYKPLLSVEAMLPSPQARVAMAQAKTLLDVARGKMLARIADSPLEIEDYAWIRDDLSFASDALRDAANPAAPSVPVDALAILQEVVQVQLANVNKSLIASVRALDLPSLVDALAGVGRDSQTLTEAQKGEFDKDVQTLGTCAARLKTIMAAHNAWQDIDNKLTGLFIVLGQPMRDLQWRMLKRTLDMVLADPVQRPLDDLGPFRTDFEAALASGDATQVMISFDPLEAYLQAEFFRVDDTFLRECDNLNAIGTGLEKVLENIRA